MVLWRTTIQLSDLLDLCLVMEYTKTSMQMVYHMFREHQICGAV